MCPTNKAIARILQQNITAICERIAGVHSMQILRLAKWSLWQDHAQPSSSFARPRRIVRNILKNIYVYWAVRTYRGSFVNNLRIKKNHFKNKKKLDSRLRATAANYYQVEIIASARTHLIFVHFYADFYVCVAAYKKIIHIHKDIVSDHTFM